MPLPSIDEKNTERGAHRMVQEQVGRSAHVQADATLPAAHGLRGERKERQAECLRAARRYLHTIPHTT